VQGLGHLIENIGRLVHPAALLAGRRIDLAQRRPEAQGAIAGNGGTGTVYIDNIGLEK
jgi:hypothetical protein